MSLLDDDSVTESTNKIGAEKMLRRVAGTKRITEDGELEDYLAWIGCATKVLQQVMLDLGLPDRIQRIHRRKFRWGVFYGNAAFMVDERKGAAVVRYWVEHKRST